MNKLKHAIKYFFSSAYRFRCNGWARLQPERITPIINEPTEEDVARFQALIKQCDDTAKNIARLLVESGMAKWKDPDGCH